jgi:hypothetical protein
MLLEGDELSARAHATHLLREIRITCPCHWCRLGPFGEADMFLRNTVCGLVKRLRRPARLPIVLGGDNEQGRSEQCGGAVSGGGGAT